MWNSRRSTATSRAEGPGTSSSMRRRGATSSSSSRSTRPRRSVPCSTAAHVRGHGQLLDHRHRPDRGFMNRSRRWCFRERSTRRPGRIRASSGVTRPTSRVAEAGRGQGPVRVREREALRLAHAPGLFDEFRICVAPVVLGTGVPLFKSGSPARPHAAQVAPVGHRRRHPPVRAKPRDA